MFIVPLLIPAQESYGGEEVRVSEKSLSMMPCKCLKKTIITEAVFMDVSVTLLDDIYHDVDTRFDSREYINFRTIGNGMYYYFMKQSKADIIPTLKGETGSSFQEKLHPVRTNTPGLK